MCSTYISSVKLGKLYTRKDLVLLETLISEFHDKYNTPEIKKLEYHFPHVCTLVMHNCVK